MEANVALIFEKEDPGNYRLPGKVMEQCFLVTISWYIKDKIIIRNSQHRFPKGVLCLTSLINVYDELGGLLDRERIVGYCLQVISFSKAFVGFSQEIFTEKLVKYGLDEHPLRYAEPARLSAG